MQPALTVVPDAREAAQRFERMLRPLLAALRASALRLTRDASEADDLLQETLLRAYRFFARYEPDTNPRAWLHTILRNTFINRYRHARREREILLEVARAVEAEARASTRELADFAVSDAVERGLSALPREFREVLWAVAVEEQSYREAAVQLGCPIGTVMSRLHRGRRALQQSLESHAAEHGFYGSAA